MSYCGIQYLNYLFILYFFVTLTEGFTDEAFAISDVDSDYMWRNSVLRARELTCNEPLLQVICQTKCGTSYSCDGGKCYCKPKTEKKKFLERAWTKIQQLLNETTRNRDSNIVTDVSDTLRTAVQAIRPEEDDSIERPALRHHIAHFCPSLEEARKCIRGCMKLGKPAFCGKDHVCYCGHRYNSHDHNKPRNLDDMYAEFRDLYEKYFGPQDGESTTVDNNHSGDDGHGVKDVNDGSEKEEWLN